MKKKLTSLFCLTLLLALAACLSARAAIYTASDYCSTCGKDTTWDFTDKYDYADSKMHHGIYQCRECCATKMISARATSGGHRGGTATCSQLAVCTVCGGEYGYYARHDLISHEGQAATCTEDGWEAYETCKNCSYTTYKEIPAGHDLVTHDAKAPTCTEAGWEEYESCKNCSYTTYAEIPALGHDAVTHKAKSATCTKAGWEEYETCSRCDYSTYKEIPALKHDYELSKVVESTCTSGGYTLYACTRCSDSYTKNPTEKLLHWFGEWTSDENGAHSATCRRDDCGHIGKADCQQVEFSVDGEAMRFCPVCGEMKDGERLEWIEKATAEAVTGVLPQGELIARSGGAFLSLAFEYAGKITTPTGKVRFTLPAEPFEGAKLMLVAPDGTETELPFEQIDEEITFELDFTEAELPVMLIRF